MYQTPPFYFYKKNVTKQVTKRLYKKYNKMIYENETVVKQKSSKI